MGLGWERGETGMMGEEGVVPDIVAVGVVVVGGVED